MKQIQQFFAFLAGIICFSGIGYSDQSGSLVVSPGSDVSWSCVLEPYETATLTITVAPPPPGYRLKEKKVKITSSSRKDFCWRGGYSVVNSACTSATTRVTVNCVWEPIPGVGVGGAGPRPPNLYGSAMGIAVAQPGEYWNEADTPEVAVGNSVVVKAWKDDHEPAPSSWSISGRRATIIGAGASATVQGTAPSAKDYDVIVHSVCDETGQSDDEMLTVVAVKSIKADPDVVCVGNTNVSYKIKTKPKGHNYMVSYTPADTSTPGIKEVIATCGSSAATCTVTVVGVESLLPDNSEREVDDGDGNPDTRTFVVNMTTTAGDLVTVTATPAPNIPEENLPDCWTLEVTEGTASGSGKLVRTINRTQASKVVLRCSCGNEKITTVYVVHCIYTSLSDNTGAIGHAWWHLEIEPDSAKAGVIERITAGLSILVDTDGGFFPMYPGDLHGDGFVRMGSQGHSATAQHDWNITFQDLMNGLNDLRSWVLSPGQYHWDTRNCVYGSLRIGTDCGVNMPSFNYPNFFTPSQLHDWLNAQP